jgi:hypothetical protein
LTNNAFSCILCDNYRGLICAAAVQRANGGCFYAVRDTSRTIGALI